MGFIFQRSMYVLQCSYMYLQQAFLFDFNDKHIRFVTHKVSMFYLIHLGVKILSEKSL